MSTDDPTLQLPSQPPRDAVPATAETTASTTAYSPATGSPAASPEKPAASATGTPRRRLRVGTVVWGLVIAAIGAGILAVSLGAEIDLELAVILLLGFAGVAMLVGSIVGGVRRERDRGRDRP